MSQNTKHTKKVSSKPKLSRRLLLMGGFGGILATGSMHGLINSHLHNAGALSASASIQQRRERIVASQRGQIMARDGSVMAMSRSVNTLIASPNVVVEYGVERTTSWLATVLNQSPEKLSQALSDQKSKYTVLARQVEAGPSRQIRLAITSGEFGGLRLEPTSRRSYPSGELGAHVVGFVNGEGVGQSGVERFYDLELTGQPGRIISDLDPSGKPIPVGRYDPLAARDGSSLQLTIDRGIQHIAEQEIEAALATYGSEGGSIIVADPRNGDILAMANRPVFDPGSLHSYNGWSRSFLNPAVSLIYDPGSTFKIFTMASALDAEAIRPHSTHNLPGIYEYWGLEFQNWDKKTYPNQSMTSVLANSSNTGALWVANRMGADRFYDYVDLFGFGRQSGIDLAGEVDGLVKTRGSLTWYPSDLAANSFGQSISVTPIQMVSAFSAIANGGELVQPRVVRSIINPTGSITDTDINKKRILKLSTVRTLQQMMYDAEHAVAGNKSLSTNYETTGKTGTAEISDNGGILPEQTIASYIGFGPLEEPSILIMVKIDRPQRGTWGSQVASPVFRRMVNRVFRYKGVPGKSQT